MESCSFLSEGCCLFSNSCSFAACFLQTMWREQTQLTGYVRKFNNSQAHVSLQRGNKVCNCAAWFECSGCPSVSATEENAMAISNLLHIPVINSILISTGNVVMGWVQRSKDIINDVYFMFMSISFFMLFHLGSFWCSAAWSSLCSQPSQLIRTSPPTVSSSW